MSFQHLMEHFIHSIKLLDTEEVYETLAKNPELVKVMENPNTRDKNEFSLSPMWEAMLYSNEQIVKHRIDFGADPNEKCDHENAPHKYCTFLQFLVSSDSPENDSKKL